MAAEALFARTDGGDPMTHVVKSLDTSVEGGSVDFLVEVVDDGRSVYANLALTTENISADPEDLDLPRKDVVKLRDLMQDTLNAMSAADSKVITPIYDALRLLMVTHYDGEVLTEKMEDEGIDIDYTDLFDRGMLTSIAIGDTWEYDTALTLKGRIHIEQVFKRVQKESV